MQCFTALKKNMYNKSSGYDGPDLPEFSTYYTPPVIIPWYNNLDQTLFSILSFSSYYTWYNKWKTPVRCFEVTSALHKNINDNTVL